MFFEGKGISFYKSIFTCKLEFRIFQLQLENVIIGLHPSCYFLIQIFFHFSYFVGTPRWPMLLFKGCVRYIFPSLFFTSKREHLWNEAKCFLFHLKSSIRAGDNQVLTFQVFICHDVMKCPDMKHEAHFTK